MRVNDGILWKIDLLCCLFIFRKRLRFSFTCWIDIFFLPCNSTFGLWMGNIHNLPNSVWAQINGRKSLAKSKAHTYKRLIFTHFVILRGEEFRLRFLIRTPLPYPPLSLFPLLLHLRLKMTVFIFRFPLDILENTSNSSKMKVCFCQY